MAAGSKTRGPRTSTAGIGRTVLGVPLAELEALLASTTMRTRWDGQVLVAEDVGQTVRVEVVPPDVAAHGAQGEIQAVVRVRAAMPAALPPPLGSLDPRAAAAWNPFAALGALHDDQGQPCVGSRLTIYEGENAWSTLQLPLLLAATVTGNAAILGAMQCAAAGQAAASGASAWGRADFERAGRMLERRFACTFDRRGLTVEFPLTDEAVSAAAGDQDTALFQLITDQLHPALGGGLLCLLQLPHRIRDEEKLHAICARLNAMEMEAVDLPPHFGAWCPGRLGDNVAYVSFLPNGLHAVPGIALNFAVWAFNRGRWGAGQISRRAML